MDFNESIKEEHVKPMIQRLLDTYNNEERKQIKKYLVGIGELAVEPLLEKLAEIIDIDDQHEIDIEYILFEIGDEAVLPLIKKVIDEDIDWTLRSRYTGIIKELGTGTIPSIIENIELKSTFPTDDKKIECMHDVLIKNGSYSVDYILDLLKKEYGSSQFWWHMNVVLSQIGEPAAQALIKSLYSFNWSDEYQEYIEDVIVNMGDKARDILVNCLEFGQYKEQIFAASILDKSGCTTIREIIEKFHNEDKSQMLFDLDNILWENLEIGLMNLYKKMGYTIEKTPKHDFGADFIATMWNKERVAVQVKRFNSTTPISSVQQAASSKKYYLCTRSEVVSLNYFSDSSKTLAKTNDVNLINRDKLEYLIDKYN